MRVVLTITSSKRLNLLTKTIETFIDKVIDNKIISEVILFDDSSDTEDTIEIVRLLQKYFKEIKVSTIFFKKNSFGVFRHAEIMKIWYEKIQEFDYCFHLEDDWECIEEFNIGDGIRVLNENINIFGVNYTWDKFDFYPENFTEKSFGDYWEWPYNNTMFNNKVWFKPYSNDFILHMYPPFSFRPSLYDISKLKKLKIEVDYNFELKAGLTLSDDMKVYLSNKKKFIHLGDNNSSYVLNESVR